MEKILCAMASFLLNLICMNNPRSFYVCVRFLSHTLGNRGDLLEWKSIGMSRKIMICTSRFLNYEYSLKIFLACSLASFQAIWSVFSWVISLHSMTFVFVCLATRIGVRVLEGFTVGKIIDKISNLSRQPSVRLKNVQRLCYREFNFPQKRIRSIFCWTRSGRDISKKLITLEFSRWLTNFDTFSNFLFHISITARW